MSNPLSSSKCDPFMNHIVKDSAISTFIDELGVLQELDFGPEDSTLTFYPSPTHDSEMMPSPTSSSSLCDDDFVSDEMRTMSFADILEGTDLQIPGNDALIETAVDDKCEDVESFIKDHNLNIVFQEITDNEPLDENVIALPKMVQRANELNVKAQVVHTKDTVVSSKVSGGKTSSSGYSLRNGKRSKRQFSLDSESSEEESVNKHIVCPASTVTSHFATSGGKGKRKLSKFDEYAKRPALEYLEDELGEADRSKKAAIQAKINREKKKAYVSDLESQVSTLAKENSVLLKSTTQYSKENKSLKEEVAYLKEVLANQSALSGLLQNIGQTKGVSLQTSFSGKRKIDIDHDYGMPVHKKGKVSRVHQLSSSVTGGVCLHVDKNNVSLEFCSKCSKMAARGGHVSDDESD